MLMVVVCVQAKLATSLTVHFSFFRTSFPRLYLQPAPPFNVHLFKDIFICLKVLGVDKPIQCFASANARLIIMLFYWNFLTHFRQCQFLHKFISMSPFQTYAQFMLNLSMPILTTDFTFQSVLSTETDFTIHDRVKLSRFCSFY